MKKKIITMLVALCAVGYLSAIDVNDNLSISGFVDGSYESGDTKTGGATDDTSSLDLDEVEIDFLFNAGGVSARVDVDQTGGEALNIEQASVSYGLEGGLTVTLGTFNSALGLEGEDPGGLYTFSRAYSAAYNLGDIDTNGAQEGIRADYAADAFSVSVSVYNGDGAAAIEGAGALENDLDVELGLGFSVNDTLSLGGGYQSTNTTAGDTDVVNVHATYTMGKLLLAGEWTSIDSGAATDRDAYLLLADFAVSDKLGVAVRYSEEDTATAGNEADKLTIAPNYAITDSLGAILEYSTSNTDDGGGSDADSIALELTFTF